MKIKAIYIFYIIIISIVLIGSLPLYVLMYERNKNLKYGGESREIISKIMKNKTIQPVYRKNIPLKGKAVWAWGSTIRKIGVNETITILKKLGINHIFILVKGIKGMVVKETIKEILPEAHKNNIYVHAWIVCFNDKSKNDAKPDSRDYRLYLLDIIADLLLLNSSNSYIDGIHLDYIRCSMNCREEWKAVSSFVNETRVLINKIAPGTVLSIASKAEAYNSIEDLLDSAMYYGQNYTDLAKYVDLFCPMTYFMDYNVDPRDVGKACYWIKKITGKPVFAGVQTHPSEHSSTFGKYPTKRDLIEVLKSCKEYKVDGVIFFALHSILDRYKDYSDIIEHFSLG